MLCTSKQTTFKPDIPLKVQLRVLATSNRALNSLNHKSKPNIYPRQGIQYDFTPNLKQNQQTKNPTAPIPQTKYLLIICSSRWTYYERRNLHSVIIVLAKTKEVDYVPFLTQSTNCVTFLRNRRIGNVSIKMFHREIKY